MALHDSYSSMQTLRIFLKLWLYAIRFVFGTHPNVVLRESPELPCVALNCTCDSLEL